MAVSHDPVIALIGNPNVGKSTVFNALTHLRQHTGNWPGKTVSAARGVYSYCGERYTLVDLPGTYSLSPAGAEEAVTRDFLLSGKADVTVVVADATCLERNLALALQVIAVTWPVVLCVNLLDEAAKKHISVDLHILQEQLGVPVVGICARRKEGLTQLQRAAAEAAKAPLPRPDAFDTPNGAVHSLQQAQRIAAAAVTADPAAHQRDRRLDRIFTSRATGIPLMLGLLGLVLWLTIAGSAAPSRWLSNLLFSRQEPLRALLQPLPVWLQSALVDGVYRTAAWVVAVMLPPMAIFFPLFTLLEDAGYLPRVAFNLDHFFRRCGAHGRQSLTMCMSLGCNACGVTGCRIIQSPRERLIAILTSSFVPCNGRFPTLIAVTSMFFVTGSGLRSTVGTAAVLFALILLSVAMTLWSSRLLSSTALRGVPSSFSLELPPYRTPQAGQVLLRSALDRTLFVLGRAVAVAAPMGLVIWLFANLSLGGSSLLHWAAAGLDPLGRALGLDGIILLGFLLGFPANEIVIPCILMGYLSTGAPVEYESLTQLRAILVSNGWTTPTAICMALFTLFHFPCGTTCLTIWRETGSLRQTFLAVILPTAVGMLCCLCAHLLCALFL